MRWVSRILSPPRSDRHVLGADLNRSELEVAPVGSRAGQSSSVTGAGGRGWDLKTFNFVHVGVRVRIGERESAHRDTQGKLSLIMGQRVWFQWAAPTGRFTLLRSASSHPVRAASAHRILYAGWSACNRIGAPERHLAELPPSRYNFEAMPNRPAPGSPECHLSPPSR